ncbi:hypothetical protein UFOVP581_54 [uncultured Caudovirales phage]|uniref:Uncharacterized protein n=1 Tax=uncultured Caudovirales phage TaxID=2100421 RepID=A0A6J5PIZ3_9CAUD|nr:hypothetical protein UFOVP581_54 [uncultured Caudovirales phage]
MNDEQKALELTVELYEKQQVIKKITKEIGISSQKCEKSYLANPEPCCLFEAYAEVNKGEFYSQEDRPDVYDLICEQCLITHNLIQTRKIKKLELGRIKRKQTMLAKSQIARRDEALEVLNSWAVTMRG